MAVSMTSHVLHFPIGKRAQHVLRMTDFLESHYLHGVYFE